MKAKEYANQFCQYLHDPLYVNMPKLAVNNAIAKILHDFLAEYLTLSKTRGKQSVAAALACYVEIDNKYRAFARLIDGLKPDGFSIALAQLYPDLWVIIQQMQDEERREKYARGWHLAR